jgi:hypothetical protein
MLLLGFLLTLCLRVLAALLWWHPGFDTDLRNMYAQASPTLQFRLLLLVSLVLLPIGCGALWTAGVWALCGYTQLDEYWHPAEVP